MSKTTSNTRLIARLDIKGPNLIKGIHLEGLRVIGDPNVYAKKYYQSGIDEIIYMDTVASLYGRNNLSDIVKKTVKDVYVPITVGGGIRSIDDVKYLLRCGAEKVAINTAENGRQKTGLDVMDWVKIGETQEAGEILLTSVDFEGTKRGFDFDLIKKVSESVSIPVIASGGMGNLEHLGKVIEESSADAVAMADILHYERSTIEDIRSYCLNNNFNVREYEES